MRITLTYDSNAVRDSTFHHTKLLETIDEEIKKLEDEGGPNIEQTDLLYKIEELHEAKCAIEGSKLASCLWEILNDILRTKHVTADSLLSDACLSEYKSNRQSTEEYLDDIVIDTMDALRIKVYNLIQSRGVINLVEDTW